MEIHTIGIDLGKTVFHLGLNRRGEELSARYATQATLDQTLGKLNSRKTAKFCTPDADLLA